MVESYNLGPVTLQPGEALVFEDMSVCSRGLVRHREGTGNFLLAGTYSSGRPSCACRASRSVDYFVDFHANIGVPTGGTVGEVQLAFAVDGTTLPSTAMRATPAAVEELFNVGRSTNVPIWKNCCQDFTVVNSGTAPVLVQEANIVINYEG